VYVCEDQHRIVLEAVKNAVAMMCIDIDIGDALKAMILAQVLDRDAAIVEYTKACRVPAPRMMQSGYWHKRALRLSGHNRIDGRQRGPDDIGSRIENSRVCRRIAVIEKADAILGSLRHQINVFRRMKKGEFVDAGAPRLGILNGGSELCACEFCLKSIMPIDAERVLIAKSIVGKGISSVYVHRIVRHGFPRKACCFLLSQHTG